MIALNQQLCDILGLTYWQQKQQKTHTPIPSINREEKELLRKILLAKGIALTNKMVQVKDQGVVVITLNKHQLIFNDASIKDQISVINLAKISQMLVSVEHKKHTWFKLKNLDLSS